MRSVKRAAFLRHDEPHDDQNGRETTNSTTKMKGWEMERRVVGPVVRQGDVMGSREREVNMAVRKRQEEDIEVTRIQEFAREVGKGVW